MIKAGKTHDISFIAPTSEDEIGLMLLWKEDSKGNKIYPYYSEADDSTLANQYYSGEPSYANLPPEREFQIAQEDWRAGMGLEIFDSADAKRYWKSINMDLRFKRQAIAAPPATSLSLPTGMSSGLAAISNTDMELTSAWTGGARSNAQKHKGTYSWLCNNATAYQDVGSPTETLRPSAIGDETNITQQYPAVVRQEYYNTGDTGTDFANGVKLLAQTFTPSASHTITKVKLKLSLEGTSATVLVGIYATSGGHPTGGALASGITIAGATAWYEISLGAGADLSANTQYAIVIRTGVITWYHWSQAPDGYAGGNKEISTNGGTSWTSYTGSDFMFEEWGTLQGGGHWDKVNEEVADEDSRYIQEGTSDTYYRDFYNLPNHTISGTISSITVYARCKANITPTQASLKIVINSGTGAEAPDTITEDTAQSVTSSWANYSETWATNPATSAAWTWAEIDALQIGVSLRKPATGAYTYCTQLWVEVTTSAAFSSSWQGKTFTFGCWVYTAAASTARIGINDGNDTTWSSYHTGNSTWQFLCVTKQLDATLSDTIRVNLASATANAAYFDDCVLGNPKIGLIRAATDFGDDHIIGYGQILVKIQNIDGATSIIGCLPADITALEPFTDGYLYIGVGGTTLYWRMDSDYALTQSDETDGMADFFQTVDSTLWKAVKPREIKTASEPEGAGWTSEDNVGSTAENITDLVEESGQIFVMKEDMPYYFDTLKVVHRLIPDLKSLQSPTSGQNTDVHLAKLYIPCGVQGLIEYESEASTWRSPARYCTNAAEYSGRVMAVTHDEEWLFIVTDYGSKVELIAGREEEVDNNTRWVWHPIGELTLSGCQYAWVSTVYRKRLYISSTDSSEGAYYYPLPVTYGDIDGDTNYTFQSDGYFITPKHHANFKADNKAFIKLTLTMSNVDVSNYFEAYYMLQGQSVWTKIGDFQTVPTSTKYIPVDAYDSEPTGVMIQFKFVCKITDTTSTPKLLGYDCRGIWYPIKRRIISCQVRVADNLLRKDGQTDDQTADEIREALDDANTASFPVTFYDPWGSETNVKFLTATSQLLQIEKERNPEAIYELVLEKVALS